MKLWRSAVKFFRKNPAIDLLAAVGVGIATVTPFWIVAGENRALESSSFDHGKKVESLESKLKKENCYLKQENEKLRKKVQLLNGTTNKTLLPPGSHDRVRN